MKITYPLTEIEKQVAAWEEGRMTPEEALERIGLILDDADVPNTAFEKRTPL